jgi:hypothetical protein
MVAGRVIPESANSLLLLLAEETLMEVAVAMRLPLSEELEPTFTVPKLSGVGETESWPWAEPEPESAMLKEESEALEATEMVPVTEPELVGAKVAVKVTLWFELRVMGKVNPLIENAAPVTLAFEIVTAEPPEFVSVSNKFVVPPT